MNIRIVLPIVFASAFFKSQDVDSLHQDYSMRKSTVSVVAGTNYIDNTLGLLYKNNTFSLKANDAFYAEFFLRYRWIDATFSFAPKFLDINNDDDAKGQTKYFNLGFAFFPSSKIRQYVGFSRMKGFYLEDSRRFLAQALELDPALIDSDKDFIFPKAEYLSFQGETSYLWKGSKEEYRSFTNMTYQPVKNEWIIMTGVAYQYNLMRNTNTIQYDNVLTTDESEDSSSGDLRIAIKSGVGMQRVLGKNWYAIVEVHPQFFYAKILDEKFHDFNFGLNSTGRIGFDNGKYFAGISGIINWTNTSSENFYSLTHWQARIGFGIRFNSPKFAEKIFDRADRELNKIKKKNGN